MEERRRYGKNNKYKVAHKKLNRLLTFNVRLMFIILVIDIILLVYSNVFVKTKKISIEYSKQIDSYTLNSKDIISKYNLNKIKLDNTDIADYINNKVIDYIRSKINSEKFDISKISTASKMYNVTNKFNDRNVNKNTTSYICTINFERGGKTNSTKLFFNYNTFAGRIFSIERVIKKDKLEEFKDLLKSKYSLNNLNLEYFTLYKDSIEVYDLEQKNSAKVKYDDIEDLIDNKVLTADNVTNYYTIFKDAIDPTKPMIALTFDDGPMTSTTTKILDILTQYHAKATFFELGIMIDEYPEMVKKIIDQGSQIGNHTNNHLNLVNQSEDKIASEINYVKKRVKELANYDVTVLRPPYGNRNDAVKKLANCPLILWNVDTLDWQSRNATSVKKEILAGASDGAIILMHDIYASTAEGLKLAMPELIDRGYQFVTIDELYYYKGKEKLPGEVVFSIK